MKRLGRRSFFGGLAGIAAALGLVKAKKVSYEEMEKAYNDVVVPGGSEFEQADFVLSAVKPLDARYTDEAGRTFQLVTRFQGDSFSIPFWKDKNTPVTYPDVKGKLVFWEDRERLIVSVYGKDPAGVAVGPIAPGHQGFIEEVYWHGQKPVETIYFHGIPIQLDQYVPQVPKKL